MFPGVGTPFSDEDIAKEMATLAKANRGTGKDLAKNLSLAIIIIKSSLTTIEFNGPVMASMKIKTVQTILLSAL
jgi:hypothetical protein